MTSSPPLASALSDLVERYRANDNMEQLITGLTALAVTADADTLWNAAEPYRDLPQVSGPLYERVVQLQPDNARALVALANAYWLTGRGPEVVGTLAARALAADQTNRGAWHLWALTEGQPRQRMERWRAVSSRFPEDDLAKANLADNAVAVADAEHDAVALAVAIDTYRELRRRATHPQQVQALDGVLNTLARWKF